MPTNGSLLTNEKIHLAKFLGLNFTFSLDGFDFESNKCRNHNQIAYEKILDNLHCYRKVYGAPPKINMTISQENAHLLHKNTLDLIKQGFTRIYLCPVFGQPWADSNTGKFIESFEKLLAAHKRLRGKIKNIRIDPIDLHREKIKQRDYAGITQSLCDMGSKVAFNVKGEAYACLTTLQLKGSHPLKAEYCLGSIHAGIDLDKMKKFKDYRIGSEFPVTCKYDFPNITCRKVCATINVKTGERLKTREIENIMKIEHTMFQRTYETYFTKALVKGVPQLVENN